MHSKPAAYTNPLNSHNHPMRCELLSPFYREENHRHRQVQQLDPTQTTGQ